MPVWDSWAGGRAAPRRAGDRGERLVVGQPDEDPLDLLVDRRVSSDSARRRAPRGERGVAGVRGEAGASGGDLPEVARAASRKPVAVAGERAPAPAPSRRGRRGRTAASPPAWSSSSPSYSYQPCSGAMLANPCAVRNRSISSSGLMPGSRRAEDLEHGRSSNTIEVLDCSTPIGRAGASSGSAAGRRAGSGTCPRALEGRSASIWRSTSRVSSGSASGIVRPPVLAADPPRGGRAWPAPSSANGSW